MEQQYMVQYLQQFQCTEQPEVPEHVEVNPPENLQEVLSVNATVEEEHAEEEVIMDNNFKIRYREPANIIREVIKQVITTQGREESTLEILSQQKTDVHEQICNIKKLIDNQTGDSDLLNKKVASSNEEIQKYRESMKYKQQCMDSLKNLRENVKTDFNNLSQQHLKLSRDYSDQRKKYQKWFSTSTIEISDIKNKIKKVRGSFKKDDRNNIIQQNTLLKQKYIEQLKILENEDLHQKFKDLDQKFKDFEVKTSKNLELQQECENRKQSLEEMKQLNHLRERDEKCNQHKELEIHTDNIKKQLLDSTEAKPHFETLTENKREYDKKLEIKTCLDTLRNEHISLDIEIDELRTKTVTLFSDYSKTVEEKNHHLLVKCNLEKEMNIYEFQKQHYQEHIENRRNKLKEFREKVNQLKEDKTLQNIINEEAYLQSSVEYLQEKLNDFKEQDEVIQSEIKRLQEGHSLIKSQLEKMREESKSMKLSENTKEIGQGQIMGILKPKAKTPPVSPKTVTFNISSQESVVNISSRESVKSSVESNNIPKEKQSHESLFDKLLNNIYQNKNMPITTRKRNFPLD